MTEYNAALVFGLMEELSISKEQAEAFLQNLKRTYGMFCSDTGMDLESFIMFVGNAAEQVSRETAILLYKDITGMDVKGE